jgi:hypothetical protein
MRDGEKENVIWATAGITFLLVLKESGKGLFVVTSYQKGFFTRRSAIVVLSYGSAGKGRGRLGNG